MSIHLAKYIKSIYVFSSNLPVGNEELIIKTVSYLPIKRIKHYTYFQIRFNYY